MKPGVEILHDPSALATRAAQLILEYSLKLTSGNGRFSIALSGGSTPKKLYQLLADSHEEFRDKFPWTQTHFFFSDERHVGPEHPDSNYRMAHDTMLARVPVPGANIHRMLGELEDAQQAAASYESGLKKFFGNVPQLDLVLLGMGTDGHTASIFPGSEVLHEHERLVAAPWVEKLNSYRLTMTLPVLNNAAAILFLVSGADKSEVLRDVLKGPDKQYPVQAIQPTSGSLTWLFDTAAASKL